VARHPSNARAAASQALAASSALDAGASPMTSVASAGLRSGTRRPADLSHSPAMKLLIVLTVADLGVAVATDVI
jgi:hypothetical protein